MLGCFDTKGEDFDFLYQSLQQLGLVVITMNIGVRRSTSSFPVDIKAEEIAQSAEASLSDLAHSKDRGLVVEVMGGGAANYLKHLQKSQPIDGFIGMGGGGGTYMVLSALQSVPIGVPKICISTVATKDISRQVGEKDIVLFPSIVDIAGLNSISKMVIQRAAGALHGMIQVSNHQTNKPTKAIAISMFGNTTACVEQCTNLLKAKGYEVMAFHAVGSGGRTMEALIKEGVFAGVLDITTTELADELCDGICSAGPDRLTAASNAGIPQVIVPGCLDMVNYGHLDTVPQRYKDRLLYSWAPDVTLMRTNKQENVALGEIIIRKLHQAKGSVHVLIPEKGISIVSSPGGIFHQPDTDQVLFETLKTGLKDKIPVQLVDLNINDDAFARLAVDTLLAMLEQ